jgi:hypothetical protein
MRWSQLKHRAEALLAESLNGRVAYYSTRYRKDHDREGRGWITVDGIQVFDMSTLRAWADQHAMTKQALGVQERWKWEHWPYQSNSGYWDYWYNKAEADRIARGVLARWDFSQALFDYLNLSPEDALASSSVILRALAMLDRRLGRRRFEKLQVLGDEHPLVRAFYELRGEAEEWATITPQAEA